MLIPSNTGKENLEEIWHQSTDKNKTENLTCRNVSIQLKPPRLRASIYIVTLLFNNAVYSSDPGNKQKDIQRAELLPSGKSTLPSCERSDKVNNIK